MNVEQQKQVTDMMNETLKRMREILGQPEFSSNETLIPAQQLKILAETLALLRAVE